MFSSSQPVRGPESGCKLTRPHLAGFLVVSVSSCYSPVPRLTRVSLLTSSTHLHRTSVPPLEPPSLTTCVPPTNSIDTCSFVHPTSATSPVHLNIASTCNSNSRASPSSVHLSSSPLTSTTLALHYIHLSHTTCTSVANSDIMDQSG